MLYDYPYKYRIKFTPSSGRKRHCVIDNPSYTTVDPDSNAHKASPGNKHALCYKKFLKACFLV